MKDRSKTIKNQVYYIFVVTLILIVFRSDIINLFNDYIK